MINDPDRIKFAIPAKGRLNEPTIELLQRAGFNFRAKGRNLYATCTNEALTFIFVRTDDIPVLVDSGAVDAGITGSDLIEERSAQADVIMPLEIGKCRLCIAVKDDYSHTELSSLNGKKIATSFPIITENYFKKHNVSVNIIKMNGSVEIMVALQLADAIVDIVETGDSLRDNNLKIFAEIGSYETVLIANKTISGDPRIEQIKRRIKGILVASKFSILEYNIPERLLPDAEKITPGYESPTISRLDEAGWLAVKVMVEKKIIHKIMDQLETLGASAIFESEIKNCRL